MAIPTDIDGTWTNSGGALDAGELRRADAAFFTGIGSAFGVGGGVARHGDTSLSVSVDGSDVVTVQPGAVLVPGNAVAGTGCYRFGLSAAITGSLAARNATNPRISLVIARYLDDDVVGTHDAYKGRIEFVDGTPGAVPAAPALPSMAVELGRITVPNTGGGAASVDLTHRTYATAVGAEQAVPTVGMLPASAPTYQLARALDTGFRHRFNGTTWDALETVWTTLTSAVTGGGIRYRRQGDLMWVQVDGTFNSVSGTDHTISTATIPAALRPSPPVGSAYYGFGSFGGRPGQIFVNTSGEVHASQQTGSPWTTVRGILSYPLG